MSMRRVGFSHAALWVLFCFTAFGVRSTFADEPPQWVSLFNGEDLTHWVDVNTSDETWSVKDGLLVCSGQPIGVMRSSKQYENFILHIEWRHMEAGGNSGVFVWSEGQVPQGASDGQLTPAALPGAPVPAPSPAHA